MKDQSVHGYKQIFTAKRPMVENKYDQLNTLSSSTCHRQITVQSAIGNHSMEEQSERCQNQRLNFAVVGRSHTGKSTFINLVRDVREGDPSFARTGSCITTETVQEYVHPKTDILSFWDVQGVGTAIVTRQKFLETVNLSSFDFCFIFLDSVFMEDDIWLAKELNSLKIPFCFVRTKIDLLFESGLNKTEAVQKNREKLLIEKRSYTQLHNAELFLISNLKEYFHVGDIKQLFEYMITTFPVLNVKVLLFFLPITPPTMVEKKYSAFIKRIEWMSFIASGISAIPLPFIDIPANFILMTNEVNLYMQGFGLDKDYVKNVPGIQHRSHYPVVVKSCTHSVKRILVFMVALALSKINYIIPIFGSILVASGTKMFVSQFLKSTLDELKKDTERVYKFYTKRE